jgi:hypothetical protein
MAVAAIVARRGRAGVAALAALAGACTKPPPPPVVELTGTLTVDGAGVGLTRCRPGHDVHVFVEIDTAQGTLRFGDGKLSWRGRELACDKLDRSWGGGVRQGGSAYFRGTLGFRCGSLVGDLALDCGQITAEEATALARNQAAARADRARAVDAGPGGAASGSGLAR